MTGRGLLGPSYGKIFKPASTRPGRVFRIGTPIKTLPWVVVYIKESFGPYHLTEPKRWTITALSTFLREWWEIDKSSYNMIYLDASRRTGGFSMPKGPKMIEILKATKPHLFDKIVFRLFSQSESEDLR